MKSSACTALALALALAACGGSPATSAPAAAADPTAAPTPVVTLVPTHAPTPVPTPRPTPVPTPTPVPATGDRESWSGFLNRSIAYNNAVMPQLQSLMDDLGTYDFDAFADDAQAIRSEALTYMDWIDVHPARACYKQVQTLARESADKVGSAMLFYVRSASTLDPDDMNMGTELLKAGNESLTRVNAAFDSVSCAE